MEVLKKTMTDESGNKFKEISGFKKEGSFMRKWGLIFKALSITAVLLVFRLVIDFLRLDILSVTNLITAFVGGAMFTIAIILTGTLTDYKESERIPSDLVTSVSALYEDSDLIRGTNADIAGELKIHVQELLLAINKNFSENVWSIGDIKKVILTINNDIYRLADRNVAPQFIVKLRTELTNIDRISNRIYAIKHVSFIPAAYAIAELAAAGVVLILFFVKLDPYYEGLVIFAVLTSLLIALLLLIKDMDDPFNIGKNSYADVDLTPLFDLEKELGRREKRV
jgi:hypothetical protein